MGDLFGGKKKLWVGLAPWLGWIPREETADGTPLPKAVQEAKFNLQLRCRNNSSLHRVGSIAIMRAEMRQCCETLMLDMVGELVEEGVRQLSRQNDDL